MVKNFITLSMLMAAAVASQSINAQDLLAGKPIFTLGEAKTWSAGDQSYTFITDDLQKLVAEPVNTSNVYLYPENGTLNTEENRALGAQGFYIDMETSKTVGSVSTTWEGAAANAYSIYLTDKVPTLDILSTTPTYEATGLGQYQANTAILPDGSKGRYLVFQVTDATNWGWGVKIRSIAAAAPQADELTTFTVTPGIVVLGEPTAVTMTMKNQLGVDLGTDKVTVTVSDNATYTDGMLTINSGDKAEFYATMGDVTMTATVYAATVAPTLPQASVITTPIFTNTTTEDNGTAGFVVAYNGGARDLGTITFANGEVARAFGNTRCVFFYNTATTGQWDADIDPSALGYKWLHLEIFATADVSGNVVFERTTVIPSNNPFTLTAGKWNTIDVNVAEETVLHTMSIRFNEENMNDLLLANVYFSKDLTTTVAEAIAAESATVDVYNMQGMAVRTGVAPADATAGLNPGLYIIAGKKVLVK